MITKDTEGGVLFYYDVIQAFRDEYFKDLLTDAHVNGDRRPVKLDKYDDEGVVCYPLKKNKIIYALPAEHINELPILVHSTEQVQSYQNVYDLITSFSTAKFVEERNFRFRELVDKLCSFEHEGHAHFTLWKIMVLASLIHRLSVRVSSPPAFGKDSVMKVLGDLTGETVVVANPTVAKLEYRLMNKSIMLNEFANLKSEDRHGMEHFLQAVGDMSNIYEKHSRASAGTMETYDISKLSVLIAYNDLDCYPNKSRYFDNIFGKQTRERFIPFKFSGTMTQQFRLVPEAKKIAHEHTDFYKQFIRSIMWYRSNWVSEYETKRFYKTKTAKDYGFKDRWASNFDTIVNFIKLYARSEEEAQELVRVLYNCHYDYEKMLYGDAQKGLFPTTPPREPEFREEKIHLGED